jgi:hypothetical protein
MVIALVECDCWRDACLIALPEDSWNLAQPTSFSEHLGMSALGQKRTFAPQKVMSALPLKADITRRVAKIGSLVPWFMRQRNIRQRIRNRNNIRLTGLLPTAAEIRRVLETEPT